MITIHYQEACEQACGFAFFTEKKCSAGQYDNNLVKLWYLFLISSIFLPTAHTVKCKF